MSDRYGGGGRSGLVIHYRRDAGVGVLAALIDALNGQPHPCRRLWDGNILEVDLVLKVGCVVLAVRQVGNPQPLDP